MLQTKDLRSELKTELFHFAARITVNRYCVGVLAKLEGVIRVAANGSWSLIVLFLKSTKNSTKNFNYDEEGKLSLPLLPSKAGRKIRKLKARFGIEKKLTKTLVLRHF